MGMELLERDRQLLGLVRYWLDGDKQRQQPTRERFTAAMVFAAAMATVAAKGDCGSNSLQGRGKQRIW